MRVWVWLVCAVWLSWASAQVQPFSLQLGDFQSQGQLELPKGSGPFPTVLLLHAGYASDMDGTFSDGGRVVSRNLKDSAAFLVEQGFAVARYNKRYVTSADQVDQTRYSRLDLNDFVADAKVVLAWLRANPRVDKNNLFAVGWSEGAMVAVQLGLQDSGLRGIVLEGPPIVIQGRDTGLLDWVKNLRLPVLILQGEADSITPPLQTKRLEAALRSRPSGSYQANYYSGLGHGLGPASSSQFAPITQGVLSDLAAWLQQQVRP